MLRAPTALELTLYDFMVRFGRIAIFFRGSRSASRGVELGSAAVVGKGGPWKFTRRARIYLEITPGAVSR